MLNHPDTIPTVRKVLLMASVATGLACSDGVDDDARARLAYIGLDLDRTVHYPIVSKQQLKSMRVAPQHLIDACFAGADPDGLYKK